MVQRMPWTGACLPIRAYTADSLTTRYDDELADRLRAVAPYEWTVSV